MAGYIGSKASVVSSGVEHKKTFTITGATTSLTGLNYTVGKVHVFQNGVRLVDGTDYTATNGTTITLTVAAQSGDNVVVISQASYQVALSGIDDQSNATAITIDSSENVGIGTSSPTRQLDVSKAGTAYIRASDTANSVNMDMLAASSGGWIGTQTNHSLMFQTNNTERLRIDSDGLKFHGDTAAANALDDYEEGTWSAGAWYAQANRYVKVGNLVMLSIDVAGPLSGTISQFTLPFTCTGTGGVSVYTSNVNFNSGYTYATVVVAGTQGYIRQCGDNLGFAALGVGQNGVIHGSITYNTTQ